MYQIVVDPISGQMIAVRYGDITIPVDNMNADYQDYLRWVAEGNTAEEWSPEDGN